MDLLATHAELGDHRYTLDATLTAVGAIGAAATVAVALVLVLRRRTLAARLRWPAPFLAGVGLGVSALPLVMSPPAGSIAQAFFGTYAAGVAAVVIAGLAAIAVAFRAPEVRSLAWLLPTWLVAQAAGVDARRAAQ